MRCSGKLNVDSEGALTCVHAYAVEWCVLQWARCGRGRGGKLLSTVPHAMPSGILLPGQAYRWWAVGPSSSEHTHDVDGAAAYGMLAGQ